MPQATFTNYLKFGEASIKRLQTYFVQDVVQNGHIRLKYDEAYSELNALEVHWKSHSSDIYSGNRPFCLELLKQAVRYLIGFAKSPYNLSATSFQSA